jgi:hypothetical protein
LPQAFVAECLNHCRPRPFWQVETSIYPRVGAHVNGSNLLMSKAALPAVIRGFVLRSGSLQTSVRTRSAPCGAGFASAPAAPPNVGSPAPLGRRCLDIMHFRC